MTTTTRASSTRTSNARGAKRPRRRVSRLTKWLLSVGVSVTLVALGSQWLLHTSFFRVQSIQIRGAAHETPAAIIRATGLDAHPTMLGLRVSSLDHGLASFPWIRSLTLVKHWPHSIVLTVHENVAVGVAFVASHHLAYVDGAGQNLGRAPLNANLPTLEYLHPTNATWPFARAGRAAAYVAGQLPPAFRSQVAMISDDATGDIRLTLTTPVVFDLGSASDLHAKFVAVASVIAHSTLVPGDVVDVSVPDELSVTPPSATSTTTTTRG